ncbi:MAG TPA: phosphate ABC transporter permease PstA [Acidimicrobiales bacterium]|jgi:phosphate transport system permease protein
MTTLSFDSSLDPILSRRAEIQKIASSSVKRRRVYSRIGIAVCLLCLIVACIPLLAIIGYTVAKGLPAWNSAFFTKNMLPEGIPGGGLYNAIIGTVIIDAIAIAVTVPFGVLGGLFLAESDGPVAGAVRFAADVLTGVPSITIGIFGYIIWVKNFGYSGYAGALAIGIIMVPVIMRAAETALRGVPINLYEAGLALGARKATVARKVTLPVALPGLITGVLLAVARGAGETAPLIFTIFGNQFLQTNPSKPMEALPIAIYSYSSQPYNDLIEIAWGGALLLMAVILVLNVGARLASARLRRERR